MLNPADFNDSLTNNGITFTNNGDGSITINGTSTGTAMLQLDKIKKTLKAGKYTFSLTNGIKDKLYMIWSAPYNSTNTIGTDMLYKEVTFDSDTELAYIYIQIPSGYTFNNVVVYPMIYKGSYDSSKPWEKYTGGQASPNSNYEQPIKSAGDNENIFDDNENNNIWINQNGDKITTEVGSNCLKYNCSEGDTFTISAKFDVVNGSSIILIAFYDKNDNLLARNVALNNEKLTLTKTAPAQTAYMYAGHFINKPVEIKLEQGNKASGYSSYGMGSINQKIQTSNLIDIIRTLGTPSNTGYDNTNKRTFDVTTLIKFLTANNYYNAGVQIDYSLIDNGIKITTKQAGYGIGFPVILSSAKTYTISANIDVIDNQMIRAIFYKEDGTYISNVTSSGTNKFLTFITTDDTYFVVVMLTPKANVETTYSNIMLNEGNTALPYVEHKEQDYSIFVQQPFRSIGDVRDVFFKNTVDSPYYDENLTLNGWYERHYIGEYIANNDLPGNGMTDTLIGLLTPILNIAPGLTGINFTSIVRSNLLQNTIINNSGLGGTNGDSRIRVNLSKDFAKTFDEANAFLTNNKFKIEFVQKEPLDLPCTETQIQQLENKPSTYKDFTIIQSEDETPAYLEVSGIYDLNNLINN